MPVQSPANTPADMVFMLGKIDGKLDGVITQLQSMSSRQDDHEKRLNDVEAMLADRPIYIEQHKKVIEKVSKLEEWKSEISGAVKLGNVMKAAVGLMVAMMLYVGYKVEFAPTTTKVTTSTQVQTSKP